MGQRSFDRYMCACCAEKADQEKLSSRSASRRPVNRGGGAITSQPDVQPSGVATTFLSRVCMACSKRMAWNISEADLLIRPCEI